MEMRRERLRHPFFLRRGMIQLFIDDNGSETVKHYEGDLPTGGDKVAYVALLMTLRKRRLEMCNDVERILLPGNHQLSTVSLSLSTDVFFSLLIGIHDF